MHTATAEDFDKIYSIMQSNFPDNEYRDYTAQKKLLDKKNYFIKTESSEAGTIEAFIAYWKFNGFIYIEHIAVAGENKGKGLGSSILKQFTVNGKLPLIAEIEPPEHSCLAQKRWRFYQRHGFYLNERRYIQPSLGKNKNPAELRIISYPAPLTGEEFCSVREILYKNVYKVKE